MAYEIQTIHLDMPLRLGTVNCYLAKTGTGYILLECTKTPALGSIMDDPETAQVSIEKLKTMAIKQVYPGHGQTFPWLALVDR